MYKELAKFLSDQFSRKVVIKGCSIPPELHNAFLDLGLKRYEIADTQSKKKIFTVFSDVKMDADEFSNRRVQNFDLIGYLRTVDERMMIIDELVGAIKSSGASEAEVKEFEHSMIEGLATPDAGVTLAELRGPNGNKIKNKLIREFEAQKLINGFFP